MASTPNVDARVQQIAEYAVKVAAERFGQSLDYSENTLPSLEALLQQAYRQNSTKAIPEETIQKTSRTWGSYLGELIRRKWGGDWVISGQDVILAINGITYSPIQQVYQRITLGQQYDIKKYIASIASDIDGEPGFSQQPSTSSITSSIKSMGSNLFQSISNFWKSGRTGKIVTVIPLLLVLCCCCIFLTQIPSTINRVAPALATPKLHDAGKPASTFTTAPISSNPLVPTASFTPTFTEPVSLSPTATFGSTSTFTLTPQTTSPLLVHFVDVGQGDSILIQTPYGQTVLVDGGEPNTGIVQYLKNLGIQRIDLMLATHPDADHIGGLVQVLQAFLVTKVVTNGQPSTTLVYENFLDAILASKADYVEGKRGDFFSLGGIDFNILNPLDVINSDENENSIVLRFTYGKTSFLLMGDAGAATESNLQALNLLSKVNILKVGHHGSTTGTTPAFLSVIKPDVAIYSAGLNNSYGLPAPQTIANLQAAGARVYGTDVNGTILVTADLNGYTVKPTRLIPTLTPTSSPTTVAALPATIPVSAGLTISSVTSPVSRGANATLTASTSPNASCSITVTYKSSPSQASGLGPKSADASGVVSWSWKVGSSTTPGVWPISVTCNGVTQTTTFIVR